MKVYDRFADEFIDETEMNLIAPPERYVEMKEDTYILKDVMLFDEKGNCCGHAMIDEKRMLLFSGYITCENAIMKGFRWERGEEE